MMLCKEIENIFKELEKQFIKKDLERFLGCNFEDLCLYHHTLGGWIRKEFLGKGSKVKELFIAGGVLQMDVMSMLVIEWFYIYAKTKQSKKGRC